MLSCGRRLFFQRLYSLRQRTSHRRFLFRYGFMQAASGSRTDGLLRRMPSKRYGRGILFCACHTVARKTAVIHALEAPFPKAYAQPQWSFRRNLQIGAGCLQLFLETGQYNREKNNNHNISHPILPLSLFEFGLYCSPCPGCAGPEIRKHPRPGHFGYGLTGVKPV